MPPPDVVNEGKTVLLQTYPGASTSQPELETVPVSNDESERTVTFFVVKDDRSYHRPSNSNQIVSLSTSAETEHQDKQEDEEEPSVLQNKSCTVLDSDRYQTGILMPSDNSQGEVISVLGIQENKKHFDNIDVKDNILNSDMYIFEEEEANSGYTESEPKQHTKTKREMPTFPCTFCSYTSHRKYMISRHMKSHSEERYLLCTVCERGFKTLSSLRNHMNTHTGVKPHHCKYCERTFTTSGEVVRHIRYKHTHEKPHRCTECNYACVELSKLQRHVRCHTGERPYQCPHCTYASPDSFKLKRHLRTHTGEKPYKCDLCNTGYSQANTLKAHLRVHNVSEKPVYPCEICPAKCGRKSDLRTHMQKIHTSEIPLKCKHCVKLFPDKYSRNLHEKTHVGEKYFKCELCTYASTKRTLLKYHMTRHTGEKAFTCDLCGRSFTRKQLLRSHHNLHHNPQYVPKPPCEKTHKCDACSKMFARKGNLIRHLAAHDHNDETIQLVEEESMSSESEARSMCEEGVEDKEKDIDNQAMSYNLLGRDELLTVADANGQHYVILEVIELEDSAKHQVPAVTPPDDTPKQHPKQDEADAEDEAKCDEVKIAEKERAKQKYFKSELDTCFGFDEVLESDEE